MSAGIEYKEWVAYPTTVLRGQQLEVAPIIVAGPRHALFLAETPNGPRHVPNHKSKQIYLRGHMYLASESIQRVERLRTGQFMGDADF